MSTGTIANEKDQPEYIQGSIDKIRNSVENRQLQLALQTVNEGSRRKSQF